MKNIKALLFTAAFVILGSSAFAADATVTFVSGKVEVQRGGKWVALQKGDTLAKSDTISTGFQSEAKIKILDSVLYLGPVTRVTLEELSSSDQEDNVNVYLKTGATRSQVRHVDNKRVAYQVHTAVAVASCRGTGWGMDDSNNIDCYENTIEVTLYDSDNPGLPGSNDFTGGNRKLGSNGGRLVNANQSVQVSDNNSVTDPINVVDQTISDITGSTGTAASKESVGGTSSSGSGVDSYVVDGGTGGSGSSSNTVLETASVSVFVELEDD